MSTLREWVEILRDDGDPLSTLMGILQIMRSGYHGYQASEAELCASCVKWIENFGHPTMERINAWVESSSKLFDVEVPDSVVVAAVSECDEDTTQNLRAHAHVRVNIEEKKLSQSQRL